MKTLLRFFPTAAVALLLAVALTSCAVIGDAFKAGAYTGIIGVIIVVGLVLWLVSKLFGGRGSGSNNV